MVSQTMQHVSVGQEPARRMWKRLGRVLLSVVAAAGLTLSMNPAAHAGGPYRYAAGGDTGQRLTVCARDLEVRHDKGGSAFGRLYENQTFTVKRVDQEFGSEWVYGFAWGNVNSDGYVQNGWFC